MCKSSNAPPDAAPCAKCFCPQLGGSATRRKREPRDGVPQDGPLADRLALEQLQARGILRTFARYVDRGMLPNRFPDAGGEAGGRAYRTGDLARYRGDGLIDPGHPPVGATGPTGFWEPEATLPIGFKAQELLQAMTLNELRRTRRFTQGTLAITGAIALDAGRVLDVEGGATWTAVNINLNASGAAGSGKALAP